MIAIDYYDIEDLERPLIYVVLISKYKGKLVLVRHKERSTWEIPGGHIEVGETPDEAAARELVEETGAVAYQVRPITDYSVTRDHGQVGYGRLYYCTIDDIGPLGDTEIGEVKMARQLPENLTYPEIQPRLLEKVMNSL